MFKQKEPNIPRMYRITCPSGPGLLLHIVPATKETRTIVVAAKNEGALVLKKDARRATRGNDPAKREHLEVHLYVEQVVTKRWEQGDAIGREELKEKVKSKFIKSNQTNFINSYLDPDKKGSFAKFITRSIRYFGFTSRCKSVSQKMPKLAGVDYSWSSACSNHHEESKSGGIDLGR
jgi:hypothetical protein